MPLLPLYGHAALRRRLDERAAAGALPASLLLHGPRGVGKQRLALWLGQRLLCDAADARPCGVCRHCRYADDLTHPDLHWFFPRPRLKDVDASPADVLDDFRDARAERVKAGGLYAAASGLDGLFVATVRAIVKQAVLSPSLAARKVFVIGDAERMAPQEGADQAANAFLKMLEEPPVDTTVILTSSEPDALLPTIRSRVVAVRVPVLREEDVRAFVADPVVDAWAGAALGDGARREERVRALGGAPGMLFGGGEQRQAADRARALVDAATLADPATAYRAAMAQGVAKARGAFSDTLDAVTVLLHARTREAVRRDRPRAAVGAARAMDAVERAKAHAAGNVSPQLVTATLLRELGEALR